MLNVETITVRRGRATILHDISLSVGPGKTLAILGESGAGKSTLIKAILGLLPVTRGTITWEGRPWGGAQDRGCCASLVLQEPRSAFNPVMSLRQSVLEPVLARKITLPEARLARLCKKLELSPELLARRPGEVSIGQAQRLAVLRALIAASPLVMFDEPLSALDAISQKRTAQLIGELQAEEGFAALIVTHDLGYAAAFSDEIAVLQAGRIVEAGPTPDFIHSPRTDYGQTLRDAAISLGVLERSSGRDIGMKSA